ncbi:MAG: recombinase family protein [Rhodomicrobium sp.]|nr:recombinase family protein [Rhodomicrobium sp.]
MTFWPRIESAGRKIGYARVSTTDQKLHMQCDALEAVGCALIFTDHGVSGARAGRPGLDKMLCEVRAGDAVVVFKLDRLGRSVFHLSDLLKRFLREDIHFCSLSEGINTTTPGGKFIYHVLAAIAELQRDHIIENTIEGMQAARRRGSKIGRPHALDDETITEAYRYIAETGLPPACVAARLNVAPITLNRGFKRLGYPSTSERNLCHQRKTDTLNLQKGDLHD